MYIRNQTACKQDERMYIMDFIKKRGNLKYKNLPVDNSFIPVSSSISLKTVVAKPSPEELALKEEYDCMRHYPRELLRKHQNKNFITHVKEETDADGFPVSKVIEEEPGLKLPPKDQQNVAAFIDKMQGRKQRGVANNMRTMLKYIAQMQQEGYELEIPEQYRWPDTSHDPDFAMRVST